MSIVGFLRELVSTGRPRVESSFPPAPPTRDEAEELDRALRGLDARARAEAPGEAPAWGLDAARWGVRTLYLAAQALTLRHLDPGAVARELARPCPGSPSPGRAWSADLTLRWLPDLTQLACGLPASDPLRGLLGRLGAAWPLSSVGLRLPADAPLEPGELELVLAHPSLSRLYADRVLARGDLSRLGPPRVQELVRAAIGAHPELCPPVAAALAEGARPEREPQEVSS